MKKIIIPFMMAAVLLSAASCSTDAGYENGNVVSAPRFSLAAPQADEVRLDYSCYAFRSVNGNDYVLFDVISPLTSGSELSWNVSEIAEYSYRLLFMAMPASETPLTVVDDSDVPAASGLNWDEISVKATALELPLHCYYGVEEKTGADLLQSSEISCTLQRLVGQMVFDFYKVDPADDGRTPIAINTDKAVSVMDRVKNIKITYSGLTDRLVFNSSNELTPAATPAPDTVQVIATEFINDITLNVGFPQSEGSALVAYPGLPEGSARVNGFYMLPTSKAKALMEFTYFGTTPLCNTEAHVHNEDCFKDPAHPCTKDEHTHDATCFNDEQVVSLGIPRGSEPLLSVLPNHITRNKGMIRCDRVIDVPYTPGFGFNVEWASN